MNYGAGVGYLCLQATREGQASHAHVLEIVKGLRKLGWDVELYQPRYANQSEAPGVWTRLIEFARVQVKFILKMRDWDAVYIRSHFAALPASAAAKLLRVPTIREVNGTYQDLFIAWPFTRIAPWLFRWVMRIQLRWSDTIITTTAGRAEWICDQGNSAVHVVPNAADIDLFCPTARAESSLQKPYALFFGSLAPWQGVSTMLEATRHPAWPNNVQLVIAGDGALREAVVEAASKVGNITYLGVVPYKKMPGVVAESICALSPQNYGEGRSKKGIDPLKVFEAMACGVPVIVTDFPGQAELIRTERCGVVIPPEDPVALATAVRQMAENPDESSCMGARGRQAAIRSHSWEHRARETDQVLRQLVSEDR